jgi:hypothetical protein
MSIEDELLELKNIIDSDIKKESEYTIKLEMILETVRNDFGCDSLEDGEKYLIELQTAKKSLQSQLESGIITLKEQLNVE